MAGTEEWFFGNIDRSNGGARNLFCTGLRSEAALVQMSAFATAAQVNPERLVAVEDVSVWAPLCIHGELLVLYEL